MTDPQPAPRVSASTSGIVVLSANWGSVVELFRAMGKRIPRLLVQMQTFSGARSLGWSIGDQRGPLPDVPSQWISRLAFPPGWCSFLATPAAMWLARRVERDCGSLGLGQPVLVLVHPQPYWRRAVRRLRPPCVVYYCVDDYRAMWPEKSRDVEREEDAIVQRSDVVLCASRFMVDELARRNPGARDRIVHLPNGTRPDFLVSQPLRGPDPLPPDVAAIRRPVLGYLGNLEGRVDWSLVDRLARECTTASMLFIGPPPRAGSADALWLSKVQAHPRFHFAGPRPQDRIMDYIRAFDVCLIPEPMGALNIAGCPQKLWNYLASSRPIVSTAVPEQSMWQPAVRIGSDHNAFIGHVREILASGENDGLAGERLEIARRHTWPVLAEQLWTILLQRGIVGQLRGVK